MAGNGIEGIKQVNTDVAKSLETKYRKKFYGENKQGLAGFKEDISCFAARIFVNSVDTTLQDGTRYTLEDNHLEIGKKGVPSFYTDAYKGDGVNDAEPVWIKGDKEGFNAYIVNSGVKVKNSKGNIEGTLSSLAVFGKSNVGVFAKGDSLKVVVKGKSRAVVKDHKTDKNNNVIETHKTAVEAEGSDGGYARVVLKDPGSTAKGSSYSSKSSSGAAYVEGRNVKGYGSGPNSHTKVKSTDKDVPSKVTAENGAIVEYWGAGNNLNGTVNEATIIVENEGSNNVYGKGTYIENGEEKEPKKLPKDSIIRQALNSIKKAVAGNNIIEQASNLQYRPDLQ